MPLKISKYFKIKYEGPYFNTIKNQYNNIMLVLIFTEINMYKKK